MIHRKPFIAACALALLSIPAVAAAPAVSAPAWTVDKASSTLGFEGVGDGSPFAGKFGSWDAAIHFDPADLAGSSAEVTVQTGSAATARCKAALSWSGRVASGVPDSDIVGSVEEIESVVEFTRNGGAKARGAWSRREPFGG